MQGALARFQRLPLHWKILLGGQGLITIGIVGYRVSMLNKKPTATPIASK